MDDLLVSLDAKSLSTNILQMEAFGPYTNIYLYQGMRREELFWGGGAAGRDSSET